MAQRIVGLDIGTSAIRAVELSIEEGSRPVLVAYGQVGMPLGAIIDGEVQDRSLVVEAIQHLWRDGAFKERRVRLGVAGLRAITREVDMPPVPPDELNDAVLFQSADTIPFPLEQTAVSSKVIANFTDPDGAPTIRVLVAAAHRDLIDGLVKAVIEAGLEPTGIDLDTAALARALHDPAFTGRAEAIVSVGAGLTMVVVHQDAELQFVRTIDLGGATITAAIAGALDLPVADAEQIKRQLDEPVDHDSRAISATSEAVEELVGEIHSSIRFFSSLPGRSAPERILVTGAGAQVSGFMTALQQGIDIPVLPAAPLSLVDTSHLPISEEQAQAINQTLAVPVGLAMPDPKGEPFNLLPPEVVEERERRRIVRFLTVCGLALLLLMVAGTMWRILTVNSNKHDVSTLQSQVTFINKVEIPKYDKVVAIANQVKALQAQYEPLVSNEVDWLVVLNQFGLYLPGNAVLTDLQMTVSSPPNSSTTKPSSASSKTPKKKAPKTSTTLAVIGNGTATVSVPNLTALPAFGTSMSASPVLTLGPLTGSLNTGSAVAFHITFTINHNAGSRRVSESLATNSMIDFAVLKKTLRRPKILLSIVGAVVILVIWAVAFFLPQGTKISSLQTQEATLQKKVQLGDATVARLRHTFQHSAQITTMRKQLYSAVPVTTDAYNYVQSLSAVAASSKVHLTSVSITVSPGANRSSAASASSKHAVAITELPVNMTVMGTYDQILTLITKIFKLPRLTDINSININGGGPNTSRSTNLSAQLSIVAFSAVRPSA